MEIILSIIAVILQLLIVLMLVAMLMSWLDVEQRSSFTRGVRSVINPLIAPWRTLIPPIGVLDLSFIIGAIMLFIMLRLVQAVNPGGFSLLPF